MAPEAAPPLPHDVFVSYADADQAWVEGYLLDALGAAGLSCETEAAFALGVPRLLEFERAVQGSRRILLVLSPAYLAEDFTRFVEILAQSHGLETGAWPVIPLVLAPVTLPPRLAQLTALDMTRQEDWDAGLARLCAALQAPAPAAAKRPACPYPGLRPFKTGEADRFFGREREIAELALAVDSQNLLFVIGPSGTGKSSLVFAGLVPRLQHDAPGQWLVRSFRPGERPLEALSTIIPGPPPDTSAAASERVAQLLVGGTSQRLLLIVDQAEELFAGTVPSADEAAFITAIQCLAEDPATRVVVTLRADFYPQLMNSAFWPLGPGQRIELATLRGEDLRLALTRPAEAVGVALEPALVERLLADAESQAGALPLLQETMHQLWKRLRRRLLTCADYAALGQGDRSGLAVAVATKADAALARLSEPERALARRIFIRLIRFGEGRPDTRRQQPVSLLRAEGDDAVLFDRTLGRLVESRLLTLGGEEGDPDAQVDIAHEVLIHGWPTLAQWRAEHRAAEQTRRQLETKAAEWVRLGRGSGGLLDPIELADAERWLGSPTAAVLGSSEDLLALIDASHGAEAAQRAEQQSFLDERQATRRRLRWVGAGLGAVALLAVALAAAAWVQQRWVLRAQTGATARQLMLESVRQGKQDPPLGLLLAVEGVAAARKADGEDLASAENTLRQALAGSWSSATLTGHAGAVSAVAFSPDGAWLAAGGEDAGGEEGGVLVWAIGASSSPPARLAPIAGPITALAFSPDGSHLAAGTADGEALLWRTGDWTAPAAQLPGHTNAVDALAFSPDGRWLATASEDAVVRLWRVDAPSEPTRLTGHGAPVDALAFSPDGRWLASGGKDRQVRLWTIEESTTGGRTTEGTPTEERPTGGTPTEERPTGKWTSGGPPLAGPTVPIGTLAFSRDGRRLAAAGRGAGVWLWDLADRSAAPIVLGGGRSEASTLAFSPDGRWLAASGAEGAEEGGVSLWDLAADAPNDGGLRLAGGSDRVDRLAFSSDGRWLAGAGSRDSEAYVWDLATAPEASATITPTVLRGHAGPVLALAFGPGGWLATGSRDRAVRLWRPDEPLAEPVVFGGFAKAVSDVAISPDGGRLAGASKDGSVRVWDLASTGRPPLVLTDGAMLLRALTFAPDGRWLATAGEDGAVRLWDLGRSEPRPEKLGAHSGGVNSLAFSPDGRWLASGGNDNTARLWNRQDPRTAPITLRGHADWVGALAIDPASRWLLSGSYDRTARLWSLASPASPPRVLDRHTGFVRALAFGPDGNRIVTADTKGTALLWDIADPDAAFAPTKLDTPAGEEIAAAAFGPDGGHVAIGTVSGDVMIWELSQAAPRRVASHALGAAVRRLAFSPDGHDLAAAGDDAVRLWSMDAPAAEPVVLAGQSGAALGLAFSPDGRRLAAGGDDRRIRLWRVRLDDLVDLACRAAGRRLSPDEWRRYVGAGAYRTTCSPADAADPGG